MSWVMPEIMLQKAIQIGMANLRANDAAFNDIFSMYLDDTLFADYGQPYIDKIRTWFKTTSIPVLQSWTLNAQRIPCYSIHLANEVEDESKAAAGDYYGEAADMSGTIGVGVVTNMVDIGIHANRSSDEVLWLYYILSYIMFKEKLTITRLGMQIHTYSASDYTKNQMTMAENIFTRWVRFKCVTENTWEQELNVETDEIDVDMQVGRANDEDDDENVDLGKVVISDD